MKYCPATYEPGMARTFFTKERATPQVVTPSMTTIMLVKLPVMM